MCVPPRGERTKTHERLARPKVNAARQMARAAFFYQIGTSAAGPFLEFAQPRSPDFSRQRLHARNTLPNARTMHQPRRPHSQARAGVCARGTGDIFLPQMKLLYFPLDTEAIADAEFLSENLGHVGTVLNIQSCESLSAIMWGVPSLFGIHFFSFPCMCSA